MLVAHSIGVVLGAGAVRDKEDLDVVVEAGVSPEALALVAADLVEGFFDFYAAAFEF